MTKLNRLEKELHQVEEDRSIVLARIKSGEADSTDYAMLRRYNESCHQIKLRAEMRMENQHGLRYHNNGHTLTVYAHPTQRVIRYINDRSVF